MPYLVSASFWFWLSSNSLVVLNRPRTSKATLASSLNFLPWVLFLLLASCTPENFSCFFFASQQRLLHTIHAVKLQSFTVWSLCITNWKDLLRVSEIKYYCRIYQSTVIEVDISCYSNTFTPEEILQDSIIKKQRSIECWISPGTQGSWSRVASREGYNFHWNLEKRWRGEGKMRKRAGWESICFLFFSNHSLVKMVYTQILYFFLLLQQETSFYNLSLFFRGAFRFIKHSEVLRWEKKKYLIKASVSLTALYHSLHRVVSFVMVKWRKLLTSFILPEGLEPDATAHKVVRLGRVDALVKHISWTAPI